MGGEREQEGAAAEQSEATGAFTFDKGLQRFPDQGELFANGGQHPRFGDQHVIESEGCAHATTPWVAAAHLGVA